MRHTLKQHLKRLAVILAASMFIVNILSSVDQNTVLADGENLTDIATINLLEFYTKDENNQHVSLLGSNPPLVAYNADQLFACIEWTFPDDPNRATIVLNNRYAYSLPTAISFTDFSGPLEDGDNTVGQYEITNNTLYITYTDQAFCDKNGRESRVTFSGIIEGDTSSSNLATEIEVAFPEINPPVTVHMFIPPDNHLDVNKDTRSVVNETEPRYRYTARVTSYGNNTNVVVNDFTTMGLYIDTNTIEFFSDAECNTPYTGTVTENSLDSGGFTYTFASMSDGESIYIRYDVTIDSRLSSADTAAAFVGTSGAYGPGGYHGNVTNTIRAKCDEYPRYHTIDYNDIGTYRVYMNKYHKSTDANTGIISWTIYIYSIPDSFNDGYIVDTLPANTEYVPGSLNVNCYGDDYTSAVPIDTSVEGQITFDINDAYIMNYLKTVNGANLQITYSTRITQQVNDTEIYTNSAELYFGGNRVDAAAADTSFTMPPILNKVGKYDDSTAPYATYTVTVNPLELNVDAAVGHNTLTLTDIFPETCDLQVNSVAITRNDTNALTTETYSYDESSRTLTIELLDNTAYTIRYRALVNRRVGTPLDASNSTNEISIPNMSPAISDSTYFQCLVMTSAGAASAYDPDIATLNVIKHETGDTSALLAGAQFSLTPMTVGTANRVTAGTAVTKTTGTSGTVSFAVARETVYMLAETRAPSGYEADEDLYFYAFANDPSTLPSTVIYNGRAYNVTIIESDRASRDIYFANDVATAAGASTTPPATPPATPPEDPPATTPAATVQSVTTTPTEPASTTPAATTPTETTAAPEQVATVAAPANTNTDPTASTASDEADPNDVNGAGRNRASGEASTTALASTGQRISFSNIFGVLIVFASFQILTYLRYDRRRAKLTQEDELQK